MRPTAALGAVTILLAAASMARAQAPAGAPPVDAVPPPPAGPVTATAAPSEEGAWALYDQAFAAASAGHDPDAEALLSELRLRFTGSGPALLGGELERLLTSRRQGSVLPPDPKLRALLPESLASPLGRVPPPASERAEPRSLVDFLRHEKPTSLARAELTFFQTINGLGVGIETCLMFDCSDARAGVLSAMLGGGIGAGGALWFSADGITPGHALAINSGSAWGFWHGIALLNALNVNGTRGAGLLAGSQVLGTLLGHLAWTAFPVGAGDVSLANSGGIWAGLLTLEIDTIIGGNRSDAALWGSLLAGSDVGLVGGALLSRVVPMSRGRTFVLDAGGVLGGLVGMGIQFLVTGNANSSRAVASSAAVGMLAGLGTAAYLSRDWDLKDVPVALGVTPTRGGAMLTMNLVP